MKITIEQTQLYNLLKSTSSIKPSTVLDVTKYNLLKVDGARLIVSATNTAIELTQYLDIGGLDSFEVLVPRTKFVNLIGSFGKGEIELELIKNDKLRVKQGKVKATLAILPDTSLFPATSGFQDDLESFEADGQELKKSLSKLIFAAATDESRPILQGIYWNETMQAIDGFRLSFISGLPSGDGLIVPANAMFELSKLLNGGTVKVQATENKIMFEFGNILFTSTLLAGSYPNVASFYETEHKNIMVLNTKQVIAELKRANIFAREAMGERVKLTANSGLKIEVQTHEDGYQSEIEVIEGIEGEVQFGVRCGYFLEALSKVDTETFTMQVEGGNNPVIIESGEFRHVIMPLSIQGE